MNGYNDDITNDQLAKLRQLFPEAFTEDKIDWAPQGDARRGGRFG